MEEILSLLTEITNQIRLFRIRSPLLIHNIPIAANVETELVITLREFIVSTFKLIDCISPIFEHAVTVGNG